MSTVAARIALVLMLFLLHTGLGTAAAAPPRATAGVIDLTGWDFATMGAVRLNGEWAFHWNQLLTPSVLAGAALPPSALWTLPGTWQGEGYGTLGLRVLLPPGTERLALHLPYMLTAHRLWVNGRLVSEAGRAGVSRGESTPVYRPETLQVENLGSALELVLQVSNHHHRAGGTHQALELGPPELLQQKAAGAQVQVAILGGLGFLGLQFLFRFGMRRHAHEYLFFGLLALTLALRYAVAHDLILTQLSVGYGWELYQKILFITPLMLQAIAVQLAAVLFPQEASPKATKVITLLSLLGIGLILAVPARVYTELLYPLIAGVLLVLVFTTLVAVRAAIHRRPDSALAISIAIAFGLSIGEEAARTFGLPIAMSWLSPLLWLLLLVVKTVLYGRDYVQLVDRQGVLLAQNSQLNSSLVTHLSELRSTRRLLSAQEEELRRRIAEFLHGRVQSKLLVAQHQLAVAREQLNSDQSETAALMEHVQVQLDSIRHQDIRLASHLLHPAAVSVGLMSALHTLAAEYEGRFTTQLEADAAITALDDPRQNQIPESVRLTAYRALSEALANSAAHAGASLVQARFSRNSVGALEIDVRDNGCGFEIDRITLGLGLRTIAARLAECDGSFTITSNPGQGTWLHLTIPLGVPDPQADLSLVDGKLPKIIQGSLHPRLDLSPVIGDAQPVVE